MGLTFLLLSSSPFQRLFRVGSHIQSSAFDDLTITQRRRLLPKPPPNLVLAFIAAFSSKDASDALNLYQALSASSL